MKSHTTTNGVVAPGNTFTETGSVSHDGRTFSSGGAYVNDERLMAYLGVLTEPTTRTGVLTTWDGTRIGQYVLRASWPTPHSNISDRMYQVECRLSDGRTYQGRSMGPGTAVTARRLARELKQQRTPCPNHCRLAEDLDLPTGTRIFNADESATVTHCRTCVDGYVQLKGRK